MTPDETDDLATIMRDSMDTLQQTLIKKNFPVDMRYGMGFVTETASVKLIVKPTVVNIKES